MHINMDLLAEKIVRECLRVGRGHNFLISCGDPDYFYFAEKLAVAAVEIGAHPRISVTSEKITLKTLDQPEEYLTASPDLSLALVEAAQVMLMLSFPKDPAVLENVPPEKLAWWSKGSLPMHKKIQDMNRDGVRLKTASLLLPTAEMAAAYGMAPNEFENLVWSALDIDYSDLNQKGEHLASILKKTDKIKITTKNGTNLEFSIKNRPIYVDDGVYSDEDIKNGLHMSNLPTGEVCCAPVQGTASGTAFFEYNIVHGVDVRDLLLTFENGKVVGIEARQGGDYYEKVLETNTGDSRMAAEFGIGLNPNARKITGNLALDEKILGTIHIATGDNRILGGTLQSSLHWDLVMQKPTVLADGKEIIAEGNSLYQQMD